MGFIIPYFVPACFEICFEIFLTFFEFFFIFKTFQNFSQKNLKNMFIIAALERASAKD
jgi:hypothetical protein